MNVSLSTSLQGRDHFVDDEKPKKEKKKKDNGSIN